MAWQQITGPWGTQICDPTNADAWVRTARARLNALINSPPSQWLDQMHAVVDAYAAIGHAYQAANISPPSHMAFRQILKHWYGIVEQASPDANQTMKFGPIQSGRGNGDIGAGGAMEARFAQAWTGNLMKDPFSATSYLCSYPVRVCLGWDGNVTQLHDVNPSTPGEGFEGLWVGCSRPNPQGHFIEQHPCDGSTPYDWTSLWWSDPPQGVTNCKVSKASFPLIWFLDPLADIIAVWEQKTALGVIDDARSFVLLVNTNAAVKLGVQIGDVAALQTSIGQELNAIATGGMPSAQRSDTEAAIAAAAAVAGAATAPYGTVIVGIAAAIAEFLVEFMPLATGACFDDLGMILPDCGIIPSGPYKGTAGDNSSPTLLAAFIWSPNAAGQMPNVPTPDGQPSAPSPFALSPALAAQAARLRAPTAAQRLASQLPQSGTFASTAAGGSSPVLLGGAALLAWLWWSGKLKM